jgi:NAD(P)-dependent dehydrogenase (short-subunit alcohol dehydrogenase family)
MKDTDERLKTAVITGAGSGVGAAIALALAAEGWRTALVGRRRELLEAVAGEISEMLTGPRDVLNDETRMPNDERRKTAALVYPCDVGDAEAVAALGTLILAELGGVEVLVNSAGTNVPRRSFEKLSMEDYHAMMAANLNGAYYCTQAFLPQMRERGSGTIVNIVSEAGKAASPKAGPGYVISKFGLAGLTQAINAEERARGIRACAIFPGDIDTPILDKRPNPPDAEARARMMMPDDIAACAMLAIQLPPRTVIEEMLVRPR